MVEVVLHLGRRLDEPETDALAQVEVHLAGPRPLEIELVGQALERLLEIGDAKSDVLQGAALARTVRSEEGQLAATRTRADEREAIRPVDHVHADVRGQEAGNRIAIRDPVGDVVELVRVHPREGTRLDPCCASLRDRLVVDVVLVRVALRQLVHGPHPLGVRVVDRDEGVPLVGKRILGEDRLDRALRLTGAAVDALLGVDHEDPARLVDAVHRANVHTGLVFDVDAGFGDDVRHGA